MCPMGYDHMDAVSREKPFPLYQQLRDYLVGRIEDGTWREGDQLPTELDFCRIFKVSRTTVKQALFELELEGRILRRQGKGTFVTSPRVAQRLALTGFSDELRQRGVEPSSRVLFLGLVSTPRRIAEALQVPVASPIWRLHRLRLGNGEPLGFQTTHLSPALCETLEKDALESGSLYRYLSDRYGLRPSRAVENYWPTLAREREDCRLLGISAGTPLLRGERRTFLEGGRPLEFVDSLWCGDRYTLMVELHD